MTIVLSLACFGAGPPEKTPNGHVFPLGPSGWSVPRPGFSGGVLVLPGRPVQGEPAHASPPPSPVIISKNMLFEADKVMFEIYRETEYTGRYRVVYFTELQDHNKESEINHALAGEHFYDGFIKNYKKDEAKQIIESLLVRLNNGEQLEPQEVERALGDHAAG